MSVHLEPISVYRQIQEQYWKVSGTCRKPPSFLLLSTQDKIWLGEYLGHLSGWAIRHDFFMSNPNRFMGMEIVETNIVKPGEFKILFEA